jgi:type IV pilus assembly protein PilM
MGLFKGDVSQIGLDIGTTAVRVVQLRPGGAKPQLVTYGAVPVDPKILQSDSPGDRQQLVAVIKKLLQDAKVTTHNVVVGLPSSKVFASLINLPKMNEQELDKSIQYQAEQYVPVPLDQVKYDWLITDDGGTGTQMEVLLVAAPNTLSESFYSLMEAVGLETVAIEPDGFGLARSLAAGAQNGVVILHFGANSTDLVTVYKGTPRLMRSIPIGGETLVKTVAQNLNLEHEQASQFVYKFGLSEGKLEGQVHRAIQSNVEGLVSEVTKSNKFFLSRYKDAKIDKVVISGGSSQLPELPNYIANEVGLPVEIGNSWNNVHFNPAQQDQLLSVSNQFSVATGLALRKKG